MFVQMFSTCWEIKATLYSGKQQTVEMSTGAVWLTAHILYPFNQMENMIHTVST